MNVYKAWNLIWVDVFTIGVWNSKAYGFDINELSDANFK